MEREVLLKIANDAIESKFDSSINLDKNTLFKDYPYLQELGACFVTLNLEGKLRGCVGTLEASLSLFDDLVINAKNAAFNDPRFYELSFDEFKKIDLEISILSKPEKLDYCDIEDLKSKIKPNVHGVILKDGMKRSTFLPQVWEQLPSFEDFFRHLCHKGNFEENFLLANPDIYVYEVNKVK